MAWSTPNPCSVRLSGSVPLRRRPRSQSFPRPSRKQPERLRLGDESTGPDKLMDTTLGANISRRGSADAAQFRAKHLGKTLLFAYDYFGVSDASTKRSHSDSPFDHFCSDGLCRRSRLSSLTSTGFSPYAMPSTRYSQLHYFSSQLRAQFQPWY